MRALTYLLPLFLLGCAEFLDVDSQDELSREETFATLRGTEAAMIGAYVGLSNGNLYRDVAVLYPEMLGNALPRLSRAAPSGEESALTNTYIQAYAISTDLDYEDNSLDLLYEDRYALLYQVNDILVNLPDLTEGSAAQRRSLEGEARFIRGLLHFGLVNDFAQPYAFTSNAGHPGVVLRLDVRPVEEVSPRSSVAEVYAAIREDWEVAATLIDARFSERTSAPVWVTPTVVRCFLARLAAYRSDWEEVDRITSGLLSGEELQLTSTENYLDEWRAGELSETLFRLDMSRQQSTNSLGLGRLIGSGLANGTEPRLNVSTDLYALFSAGDVRRQLYPEEEDKGRVTDKYTVIDRNSIPEPILFRVSELYLLRAEALYHVGDAAGSVSVLNRVRERSWPGAPPLPPGGEALLEAIYLESRKELALEGHYFYDLRRRGLDVERDDCLSFVETCTLTYPDYRYALPIPRDVIFSNPEIKQNDGY